MTHGLQQEMLEDSIKKGSPLYNQHLKERQKRMQEQAWGKLNQQRQLNTTSSGVEDLVPSGILNHHPAGSDLRGIVSNDSASQLPRKKCVQI